MAQYGQTCLAGLLDVPPLVSYRAVMAIHAGRHQFGTDKGRITLRTSRDGLVASAGHDLTIDAVRWSGELVVGGDGAPASLAVKVDLGALVVRSGSGGIKPLTDRDRREIAVTARKVLKADRNPEATFTGTSFDPAANGGGTIGGTLTLAGQTRPVRLEVTQTAPGHYRAATTVRQTDFGIKPYSAFLGSLKVADAVEITVELDLSHADDQEPTT
jgi:polyisoprenoid-binding protein YceI